MCSFCVFICVFTLPICSFRTVKQAGTGSAGTVETGFSRVGRDAPVARSEGGGTGLEDIAAPDSTGDDDFFSVSSVLSFLLFFSPEISF